MICSPAKDWPGPLLQNEQLATNVQAIAYNLAVTSSNLNRLGLWRFLWHHEPVSTNAPLQPAIRDAQTRRTPT